MDNRKRDRTSVNLCMLNESSKVLDVEFYEGCYHIKTTDGFVTHIDKSVFSAIQWKELKGLFTGTRDPNPLSTVTRIVGYFSMTKNWNKSKIGELKDRREGALAGNYAIT